MRILNKNVPHSFQMLETFEAGIELLGSEVKAIRLGHADLAGSYVKIIGNEAFLINARIIPYAYSRVAGYDEKRTRKLLLHQKQIRHLHEKIKSPSLTLIPTKLYNKGPFFKLEIALARGKKEFEKREDLRKKDLNREIERELKNR